MPATIEKMKANRRSFAPNELAHMESIIEAVCFELNVSVGDTVRREAIAQRIVSAYSGGSRLPLNMVSAGLAEHTAA